jgi:hypothetical protein
LRRGAIGGGRGCSAHFRERGAGDFDGVPEISTLRVATRLELIQLPVILPRVEKLGLQLLVGDEFAPQGNGGYPGEGIKEPRGGVAQKAGAFTAVTEKVTVKGDVLGDDVAVFVLDVDDAVADGSARVRICAVVACIQVARGFEGFRGGGGGYLGSAVVRHIFGK